MKHIIKDYGGVELYDPSKLQSSIKRTLISCQVERKMAEEQSKKITDDFSNWLKPKSEITSLDIRSKVANMLIEYNKNAAILYKNHKELW